MYKWYTFCHSQEYFVHFVFQCDKRFFWNEFMVKELLNSEVGFFSLCTMCIHAYRNYCPDASSTLYVPTGKEGINQFI